MPTYDYHCEKCKKGFEFFQSMKDAALETCPESHCQRKTWAKGKVKRQVGSGAGLIFKGSGFYITDYRSEGYKKAAKGDQAPSAASTGSDASSATKSAKSESGGATSSSSSSTKPSQAGKTAKTEKKSS